ncbi:nucleolar pre-ribosomal-associated protein 1 isoform X2 [Syngnathoides biaculeatus]|uniref:nucleolar pre-ribosomal-associated protein 1 isoform X2 n=1 Tax=Syngnathoides biaculeatus TaxID=300417 RepID=UPI002ADD93CD|nr:nucleolar pre-ribosomal-associated protein 1 isoform X2 [Syngnathoides biaculeatus]
MGKKRPSDETPEPNAAAKKEKMTEFNGTLFKSMLKDPTKAMKGLEMFIATAKKLPSSELYDVVEGYIKISMECAEMFKLLEGGKQTEREMVLIFESLEMILLRTASDLTHFSMVGNAIVKKVVASHMKLIQGSFQSENHRLVRQCLSLLSASISQGPEAAREILNHIYINKSLSALARRKDKRGKPDIRMAFIQFALSFLVSGDNATIGQILEVKELLPEILSTGLKEDRMSIVNLILSTLKSRVVLNKAITKTQKVRFFTAPQLANIASLYKWNGIVDAIVDDNEMEDGSEVAAIAVVREMAHSFLLDLCCSRRHGISFHDPSFGTAGRAGNIVLLQFLVGLKQATEDELVAELVVRTLKASPDVLTRYFKEMQYSYLPRLKSAWQDNVRLLKKIYEAQPELSVVFQPSELVALPRLLSMITVVSLPPVCNKAFFTQGLNFANTAVQLTTFTMMSFILKKAAKNVAFLKGYHSDVYTPDMMADLVQQYTEMLTKILPDMTSVVSQWQSLSKKDKTEGEGSKTDKDASEEQTAPDTPEVVLLKALILQVICLYQKVVPHLVTQCKFDFSKLLKGVVSEGGVNEEVAPVLQHQILQLALDLPASKFSWFRLQEAADNDEKSVLYLLLKMFVSSRCGHLKNSTRMLVLKVLKDSGVFEYTWAELELWLDQLDLVEPSQQEMVIQFLERVFVKLVSHSHMYTDTVASLVQEAAYQQSNLSSQEGDAASVCVSHIDDVLDMLDVIMDGSEGDAEELDTPLSEDIVVQTFPFSVAVPAALEARNKLNQDKGVVFEYLSTVLCHILHGQRDPLPLCLGLLQYDKKLASSCSSEPPVSPHVSVLHLHRYYSEWLPQQCREELFKCSQCLPDKTSTLSFTSLMKAAYLDGLCVVLEDKFRTKVEVAIDSMTVAEHLVSIKQILLYVKSAVDNFISFSKNTGSAVLKTLMGILQDLVSKLQRRQVPSDPEPAEQNNLDGSDLFLDMNQSSNVEANKEQILLSALKCIFQHPCFLQWYLSLELGALPPHPLNPVRLKHMCAQLSNDITTLLMISAPTLCELGHTEILAPYVGAVEKAVLKELLERPSQTPKRQSKPFQAFLSLHSYMDPSKVRDLLSALLLLQQERLVTAQGELSVYGQATLQILTETDQYRDDGIFLSQARLGGLATLLLSCASPALEAFLLQTLSREPGSARLVHTDVLHHCLRRPLRDPLAIADLLVSNCSTQRLCFEMWCLQAENLEKMTNMTEEFLPLIRAYLLVVGREDPAVPKEVQQEVLKSLKENLLAKLIQSALRESIENATLVEALAALIKLTADIGDIWDLVHNLPDALQKADSFERWQLVDVITEKLCNCPEEEVTWRKLVTAAALKCLVASYGQAKDQAKSTSKQEQSVLERLQSLITSADDVAAADWNAFVKNGLKYRYRDEHFLTTLRSLLEIVYRPTDITDDLVPLATLHMMTSSHSLFLPTMLDSEDGDLSTCHAKEALVSLLLCLVKKCPAACNMNHFLVLLGAYGATLNNTDQTILLLLQEYEKNNVSLLKFQSIMWGPAALEHHKTRKSLASSLWKQTHADDLLALLNADKMLRTIAQFPQHRKIIPQADKAQLFHDKAVNNLEELYDPCFLLPLFSAILRPESVVDCQKFVSAHALGLTVVALSSYDGKVRAGAYHVLSCFYQHLEGARFREKKQLLYLLDTVKNGVRQENQRIPFVLTTYISKVAQQMLKPEDYMYVVLNRFLLSHQSLDLHRVPEFFKLFYSFDLEHKTEREWILSVLEGGISDGYCYEVCNQQGIFHSLLGFGSSPLCDDRTQAQIIRVLSQAARVTKAAYDLSKSCGLLTWIIHMVEKRQLGQHLLGSIIDLLHVLWLTNLGKKENPIAKGETSTLEQETVKCLPLTLINEFLCAALTIIPRLRLGVKAAQLSTFLQTLSSILKHRTSALHVSDQAGRVTLQAQPLSSAEAVALLMCWSTLSGHTTLLGQKQTLFEKHQVKELLGRATRGKIRCKGSQARTHKENLSEDTETEERQQSLLTECRLTLGSIFVHWRPVFAPSEPDCTEGPNLLAVETGVLLTKWSLGCLVEGSYDEERSKGFLHWIEESVMEYGEIVDALLRDAEFNADLLRLYHHTCQTSTGETFRSFTDLMRRLLERRGQLSAMHRAVVSACQPEDEAKCEAGLSLLSLYIHEMWSGADSPQLFLSHVAMVTRSGRKQRKALPSAVRAVCQDFLAART